MFQSALSQSEKLALISNFGVMLAAGIPLLEIIESLLIDAKGAQQRILKTLQADLKQGQTLASTFSKFPKSFDPIFVNLVKAGEQSGTLDVTLKNLEATIKKEIEFSDKIKAALAYPVLVVIVFTAVLIMILTFVVPKISQVFVKLRVDLPLPTKVLVFLSNFFLQFTPLIIILAVLLFLAAYLLYKTQKRYFFNLIFSLPLISRLGKYIDLTRFSRSLALLLSSGIPIIEALELSRQVVVRAEIGRAVERAKQAVMAGQPLSFGLKQTKGAIPAMMIRLINAGERSGSLDRSMLEIAQYYDNQVSNSLKIISELLEPALLIIIGLLVGGTMLAIVAPIYQMIGQIKVR